jgi:hypothetical protein
MSHSSRNPQAANREAMVMPPDCVAGPASRGCNQAHGPSRIIVKWAIHRGAPHP